MDHDLSSRHNIMIRACLPKNDKKLMKMMLYEDDQEIDLGAVAKNVSGGLGGEYQISADFKFLDFHDTAVADPGGMPRGPCPPPSPVQISHKKDGRQRRPHRFHVSWLAPYPAAGSDAAQKLRLSRYWF